MLKDLKTDEKILHLLRLQPRLTKVQLAKIIDPEGASGIELGKLPKNPAYNRIAKALKTLEKNKIVEQRRLGEKSQAYWFLKGARVPNKFTEPHDYLTGELFAVFYLYVENWSSDRQGKHFRYDIRFEYRGKIVYLEIETGSQYNTEKVPEKIDRYVKHFHETRESFFLIFATRDYQPDPVKGIRVTAKDFAYDILDMFEEKNLNEHYLVTSFEWLAQNGVNANLLTRFDNLYTIKNLPE